MGILVDGFVTISIIRGRSFIDGRYLGMRREWTVGKGSLAGEISYDRSG